MGEGEVWGEDAPPLTSKNLSPSLETEIRGLQKNGQKKGVKLRFKKRFLKWRAGPFLLKKLFSFSLIFYKFPAFFFINWFFPSPLYPFHIRWQKVSLPLELFWEVLKFLAHSPPPLEKSRRPCVITTGLYTLLSIETEKCQLVALQFLKGVGTKVRLQISLSPSDMWRTVRRLNFVFHILVLCALQKKKFTMTFGKIFPTALPTSNSMGNMFKWHRAERFFYPLLKKRQAHTRAERERSNREISLFIFPTSLAVTMQQAPLLTDFITTRVDWPVTTIEWSMLHTR